MCCFSQSVIRVSNTRIFARALDSVNQVLIYSMTVAADQALAMILPLPVPLGVADDALTFIDLQGYPDIFDDIEKAFPPPMAFGGMSSQSRQPAPCAALQVHNVGKFEASFVPCARDFDRLDRRGMRTNEDVFVGTT